MSLRVVAGSVSAALLLLLVPSAGPAHAHDVLERTAPTGGATLRTAPDEVTLTFNDTVLALGTAVRVASPDGDVQSGAAQVVDDTVTQPLAADRPAGAYTVYWRVTSADGHPVTGRFGFQAERGAGKAGTSATADRSATATAGPASESSEGVSRDGRTSVTEIVVFGLIGLLLGVVYVLLSRRHSRRTGGEDAR